MLPFLPYTSLNYTLWAKLSSLLPNNKKYIQVLVLNMSKKKKKKKKSKLGVSTILQGFPKMFEEDLLAS